MTSLLVKGRRLSDGSETWMEAPENHAGLCAIMEWLTVERIRVTQTVRHEWPE